MQELHAGDWVNPSVRLLRPLAPAAWARVWVAEHLALEHARRREVHGDGDRRHGDGAARFAREAAAAAAVKSPHVVQTFDSRRHHDGDRRTS